MSIITTEVEIGIGPNNINHYKLIYDIPTYIDKKGRTKVRRGTKIIVKVQDLPKNSRVKVLVKCDNPECTSNPKMLSFGYIPLNRPYLCQQCAVKTESRREKLKISHIGYKHSEKTLQKMIKNNWMNGRTGERHPNWDAEKTNEQRKQGHSVPGIGRWKRLVRKRDENTCQCCGVRENLCAHHKDNFADFIEQRTNIDNGVLLCENCHHLFHHIYGIEHTTKKDFDEFISLLRFLKIKDILKLIISIRNKNSQVSNLNIFN